MSYLDIVAEVRRLPLHEQLRLMEELVHALPTDEEIRQIIADDLLDKHA
jgi:hypothetical protein